MREIIVKAWDKKNNEMIGLVGWRLYNLNQYQLFTWDGSRILNREDVEFLLFTGLRDRNGKGKDVYRDDIIGSFRGVKYLVYWNREKGQWYSRIVNKTKGVHIRPLWEILNDSYAKIIGNVHQNPELLEQKGAE